MTRVRKNEYYTILWISKQFIHLIIGQTIKRLSRAILGKEECFTIYQLQMAQYSSQDDVYQQYGSKKKKTFRLCGGDSSLFLQCFSKGDEKQPCTFSVTLVVHYGAQRKRLRRLHVVPRGEPFFCLGLYATRKHTVFLCLLISLTPARQTSQLIRTNGEKQLICRLFQNETTGFFRVIRNPYRLFTTQFEKIT